MQQPERRLALVLVPLLFALACAPEQPETLPDTPSPAASLDCDALLAAWDADMGVDDDDATPVVLGPGALRDLDRNEVRAAADGDADTSEVIHVGSSVVLAMEDARFVRALRYTPRAGEAPLTDFAIYLSPTPDCWGEPAAVGSFDGSDAAQEVALDGRRAAFLRIDLLGAAGGADRVGVSELGVVVGAEIASSPERSAIVGVEWLYEARADVPGSEPLGYEVIVGPSDMRVDDAGVVVWTPAEGSEGDHEVTLRALRGAVSVDQTFTLHVVGRTVVGSADVPAGGGTVTIAVAEGESMAVPEMTVTVESADAPAGTIEIHAVAEVTAPESSVLRPLGVPFVIHTDLPAGTELTITFPVAGIPGLPADSPEDAVYVTSYPQDWLGHGHDGSRWGTLHSERGIGSRIWSWIVGEDTAFQVNEGVSIEYTVDEFHITYMLEPSDRREAVERRLRMVGELLVDSRQTLTGMGCRSHASQEVEITPMPTDLLGRVMPSTMMLSLNKGFVDGSPRNSVAPIVAHELFHTYQVPAVTGSIISEKWWLEGTAAFMEDEVIDTDQWGPRWGPWMRSATSQSIREHYYYNIGYWKSLKATSGFNGCAYIDAVAASGTGVAALGQMLGGEDAVTESIATYVAAYNHVRESSVIDDVGVFFPSGKSDYTDPVSGTLGTEGYREYEWNRSASSSTGGESARLTLEEEGTMEIEVRQPADGFHVLVYDHTESLLGEIRPGDGMVSFEVTGDAVYLDIGLELGGSPSGIEIYARIMAAPQCASSGAPCGGSGASFDEECCEGQICVVGACRPNQGGRERASCTDALGCASGLICNEVGSAEAATTCCARDTDYCEAKSDCCGLMDCVDNRCVGRTSGEECLLGDCVGTSFCDSDEGVCT